MFNFRHPLYIAMFCYFGWTSCANAQIGKSVGEGGINAPFDVKTIQQLLNKVSDLSGGPIAQLAENGLIGPDTNAAILRFEKWQVGSSDGRIDPGFATDLRLQRLNGHHVVLGKADTADEKKLAEFTSTFANIIVKVDGKNVSLRPPYYINAGQRRADALANRNANPAVKNLITQEFGNGGATLGKATPGEIKSFLQAAIDSDLVANKKPDGLRAFLAKFGISTDCSGLAARACNLLKPANPLDVVGVANTAHLATLTKINSPAELKAGHMMVKSGSHVRLITDVDETANGIEFTTLESTASKVLPNGNGIGERRWKFPNKQQFENLELRKGSSFQVASDEDKSYLYTTK